MGSYGGRSRGTISTSSKSDTDTNWVPLGVPGLEFTVRARNLRRQAFSLETSTLQLTVVALRHPTEHERLLLSSARVEVSFGGEIVTWSGQTYPTTISQVRLLVHSSFCVRKYTDHGKCFPPTSGILSGGLLVRYDLDDSTPIQLAQVSTRTNPAQPNVRCHVLRAIPCYQMLYYEVTRWSQIFR